MTMTAPLKGTAAESYQLFRIARLLDDVDVRRSGSDAISGSAQRRKISWRKTTEHPPRRSKATPSALKQSSGRRLQRAVRARLIDRWGQMLGQELEHTVHRNAEVLRQLLDL